MKPIKPNLPFLEPENTHVGDHFIEKAMLSIAQSIFRSHERWTAEFYELCRAVDLGSDNDWAAAEIAIRNHIKDNRLRLERRLKPESLYDQETGEFIQNHMIEVYCAIAEDCLWTWLKARQSTMVSPTDSNVTKPAKTVGKMVNARMLEKLSQGKDCHGWTCTQWATYLKCSTASVVVTETWKNLADIRNSQKQDRRIDRHRNGKPFGDNS